MRTAKHILSIFLILAMLTAGLPYFRLEDASRNNRVDLEDAILLIKEFARTAEEPAGFKSSAEKVFSALHVAAGLKTVIKKAGDETSSTSSISLEIPYLISSNAPVTLPDMISKLPAETLLFESIISGPSTPPPRHV